MAWMCKINLHYHSRVIKVKENKASCQTHISRHHSNLSPSICQTLIIGILTAMRQSIFIWNACKNKNWKKSWQNKAPCGVRSSNDCEINQRGNRRRFTLGQASKRFGCFIMRVHLVMQCFQQLYFWFNWGILVVPQPLYSPDLSPYDFFSLPQLKGTSF